MSETTSAPETVRCDWCDKDAVVYDRKPDGHVWYECPDDHLSLWDPTDRTTVFADERLA